tara:strand:+ start:1399 stop:2544 length:1146 start_codon:yes stop_codon:yes gene_type:complete
MMNDHIPESPKASDILLNKHTGKSVSGLNKKNREHFLKSSHNTNRHQSTDEIIEKFTNGNSSLKKHDSSSIQTSQNSDKGNLEDLNETKKIQNEVIRSSTSTDTSKGLNQLTSIGKNGNIELKSQVGSVRFTLESNDQSISKLNGKMTNPNPIGIEMPVVSDKQNSFSLKELRQSIDRKFNQQLPELDNKNKFLSDDKTNDNNDPELLSDNKEETVSDTPKNGSNHIHSLPVFDITYIESGNETVNLSAEKFSTFKSAVVNLYDLNHMRFVEGKIKGNEKGKFIIHTREFGKIQLNFRNEETTLYIEIISENNLSEKNLKSQLMDIKHGILAISPALKDVQFTFNRFNIGASDKNSEISNTTQNSITRFTVNENHQLNQLA